MALSLFEIIEPSVRNHPERPAIVAAEGGRISYRRLAKLVDSWAMHAARAGISKGDHVAIHLQSRPSFFCMMLALSKLGAVRVPQHEAAASAVDSVKVDYSIVGPDPALTGPGVVKMNSGWSEPPAGDPPMPMAGLDTPEDTAVILSSSGTTGRPKLLRFTLALIHQAIEDQGTFVGTLDRRTLLLMPPHTSFGLEMALLTLRSGGQITWAPAAGYLATLPLLVGGQIDDIIATPAVYSRFVENLKARDIRLESIKRAIMAGSVASQGLVNSIQEFICRNLINNYGSSELGPCACSHVDEVAGIPGAVGKLAPWMDIRISDDQGNELPRGKTGLLQLRIKPGRRVATYVGVSASGGDPAGDWFIPGDLGSLTEDGVLCIQGRASDLMNIGGTKVAPSIVEELVTRFLGENEMVSAFGLQGANGFDEVVVAIDARNAPRIEGLRNHINGSNKQLGRVHIMAIEAFPLNESGKVDKIRLRELASAAVARQGS
jgi:acyl-coenzyme A synthetase/AMP-(fatty) acid ligase